MRFTVAKVFEDEDSDPLKDNVPKFHTNDIYEAREKAEAYTDPIRGYVGLIWDNVKKDIVL